MEDQEWAFVTFTNSQDSTPVRGVSSETEVSEGHLANQQMEAASNEDLPSREGSFEEVAAENQALKSCEEPAMSPYDQAPHSCLSAPSTLQAAAAVGCSVVGEESSFDDEDMPAALRTSSGGAQMPDGHKTHGAKGPLQEQQCQEQVQEREQPLACQASSPAGAAGGQQVPTSRGVVAEAASSRSLSQETCTGPGITSDEAAAAAAAAFENDDGTPISLWRVTSERIALIKEACRSTVHVQPTAQHKYLRVLVVGSPGIGKSSLVRNMWSPFAIKHSTEAASLPLADQGCTTEAEGGLGISPTATTGTGNSSLEEGGILTQTWEAEARAGLTTYHYTILEASVDDHNWFQQHEALKGAVEQGYDRYLVAESDPLRMQPLQDVTDPRYDVCIVLLPPDDAREMDIDDFAWTEREFIDLLACYLPVIPVVAQADRLCPEDLEDLRHDLNHLLCMTGPVMYHGLSVAAKAALGQLLYCRTASGQDGKDRGGSQGSVAGAGMEEEAWTRDGRFPLAVVAGSEAEESSLHPWATSEAFLCPQSDVLALRRLLLETGLEPLKACTEARYLHYRSLKLVPPRGPAAGQPSALHVSTAGIAGSSLAGVAHGDTRTPPRAVEGDNTPTKRAAAKAAAAGNGPGSKKAKKDPAQRAQQAQQGSTVAASGKGGEPRPTAAAGASRRAAAAEAGTAGVGGWPGNKGEQQGAQQARQGTAVGSGAPASAAPSTPQPRSTSARGPAPRPSSTSTRRSATARRRLTYSQKAFVFLLLLSLEGLAVNWWLVSRLPARQAARSHVQPTHNAGASPHLPGAAAAPGIGASISSKAMGTSSARLSVEARLSRLEITTNLSVEEGSNIWKPGLSRLEASADRTDWRLQEHGRRLALLTAELADVRGGLHPMDRRGRQAVGKAGDAAGLAQDQAQGQIACPRLMRYLILLQVQAQVDALRTSLADAYRIIYDQLLPRAEESGTAPAGLTQLSDQVAALEVSLSSLSATFDERITRALQQAPGQRQQGALVRGMTSADDNKGQTTRGSSSHNNPFSPVGEKGSKGSEPGHSRAQQGSEPGHSRAGMLGAVKGVYKQWRRQVAKDLRRQAGKHSRAFEETLKRVLKAVGERFEGLEDDMDSQEYDMLRQRREVKGQVALLDAKVTDLQVDLEALREEVKDDISQVAVRAVTASEALPKEVDRLMDGMDATLAVLEGRVAALELQLENRPLLERAKITMGAHQPGDASKAQASNEEGGGWGGWWVAEDEDD
ncbi:hypothetical protein N2152v2_002624 [Parachlorella kessleri]